MTNIESALSPACGLNSPPSVITSTSPDSPLRHRDLGVFRGLMWALIIETVAVAVVYGAILTLRMAFR